MYAKAIIIIVWVLLIIVILLFLKGGTFRSRIQSDNDNIDRIKESNRETERIYSELEKSARDRREITDEIERDNRNAGSGIDEAIRILKGAKEREDS